MNFEAMVHLGSIASQSHPKLELIATQLSLPHQCGDWQIALLAVKAPEVYVTISSSAVSFLTPQLTHLWMHALSHIQDTSL